MPQTIAPLPAVLAETPGHACNAACRMALTSYCVCACAGDNHGAGHLPGGVSKPMKPRSSNPFAGLPVAASDNPADWF